MGVGKLENKFEQGNESKNNKNLTDHQNEISGKDILWNLNNENYEEFVENQNRRRNQENEEWSHTINGVIRNNEEFNLIRKRTEMWAKMQEETEEFFKDNDEYVENWMWYLKEHTKFLEESNTDKEGKLDEENFNEQIYEWMDIEWDSALDTLLKIEKWNQKRKQNMAWAKNQLQIRNLIFQRKNRFLEKKLENYGEERINQIKNMEKENQERESFYNQKIEKWLEVKKSMDRIHEDKVELLKAKLEFFVLIDDTEAIQQIMFELLAENTSFSWFTTYVNFLELFDLKDDDAIALRNQMSEKETIGIKELTEIGKMFKWKVRQIEVSSRLREIESNDNEENEEMEDKNKEDKIEPLGVNYDLMYFFDESVLFDPIEINLDNFLEYQNCKEKLIGQIFDQIPKHVTHLEINSLENTTLDLSRFRNLESISLNGKLKNLDVSKNTKLRNIRVFELGLKNIIGLENLENLRYLNCGCNDLEEISVWNNEQLQILNIADNHKIRKIYLLNNEKLKGINCKGTSIDKITITKENKIERKNIVVDDITSIVIL